MMSDMENREWINDYMSLKQVSPANPFTVPDGYFDDLTSRIVSHKNLDELVTNDPSGGFALPENYFDELTANIQSRVNIDHSLNTTDTGFTVREGYFDNLAGQIQSRVFIEEALGEPAEAFTVPDGYFENLNKSILNKTVNAEPAKVNKGIVRRMVTSTAFKYATAACFALAIGGGILISEINSNNAHTNTFLHKQLSNVPVDDIENYLRLNVDAGDIQQTEAVEGAPIDTKSLKEALQNDIDSVQ